MTLVAILLPNVFGGGGGSTARTPAGMAIIDAQTGEQLAFVPRSAVEEPAEAIYADGHFWVLNLSPISFVEIDPAAGKVLRQIASPFDDVGYFAVDGNTVWVTQYDGPGLSKIDVTLGREVDRFTLSDDPQQGGTSGVVVGAGSVWVGRPGEDDGHGRIGMILRVDPDDGRVEHRFPAMYGVYGLSFGDDQVWTNANGVTRIDPATNAVVARAGILGNPAYVAAGGGFGWASDETKGVVYKIGREGDVAATYDTGGGARVVSYSDGVLWVGNQDAGTVTGIDAVTGERRTYRFEHPLQAISAGDGVVLVQLNPGRTYEDRIDALTGNVAKLLIHSYQLEAPDPATLWTFVGFQVEYATCAKLLNYPDAPSPEGAQLQPEVASSMPDVSTDGRTYTFAIQDGYAFSPPSNEPVTAETFRYSIERALSPKIDGPGPDFLGDIEGEDAFLAGKAEHISGLRADGNTLTIALTEPSGNFLQRLAMPFFCPVSTDTAIVAGGAVRGAVSGVGGGQTVPSAGPYYIADQFNGEYTILKRNPNYTGPRPHAFDAIALREGIDPGQAVARVNGGAWDGITNLYDPLLDLGGALSEQWGPASQAVADGDQRYFATPWPHTGFIALNASRPLFANADVRRAAALALDRQALAAVYGQIPTAQLLPPAMPGYEDRDLEGPDIAAAKALMDGRTGTAVMAIFSDCPTCVQEAQVVQAGLARIGIDVRIEEFDNPFDAVRQPGAKIDLLDDGTSQWLADPASLLSQMLLEDMPTSWLPPGVEARVRDVLALEGPERVAAAASLADELATKDVPVVADGISVIGEFLSPRLGCLVFPPFGYGVDLAALCPNGGG